MDFIQISEAFRIREEESELYNNPEVEPDIKDPSHDKIPKTKISLKDQLKQAFEDLSLEDPKYMDDFEFLTSLKDFGFFTQKFTTIDAAITFDSVKQNGMNKIDFEQFKEAIFIIANKQSLLYDDIAYKLTNPISKNTNKTLSKYKHIKTSEAGNLLKESNECRQKIPFIIDCDESEPLTVFYKYSGILCTVGTMVVQNLFGGSNDIADEMRRNYVNSCKYGHSLVYHLGQAFPAKWSTWSSKKQQEFNQEIIFNCERNKQRESF